VALLSAWLVACGSEVTESTSPPTALTPSPTEVATAAAPVALDATATVDVTREAADGVMDPYASGDTDTATPWYADDAVITDHSSDEVYDKATWTAFTAHAYQEMETGLVATYAGEGWAIGEGCNEIPGAVVPHVSVFQVKDGKVIAQDLYYSGVASEGSAPRTVAEPPTTADTPATCTEITRAYATALGAADVDGLAALCGDDVSFLETTSDTALSGPAAVVMFYEGLFARSDSFGFADLRYFAGQGFGAVLWQAGAGTTPGAGVTVLEIRDGKIARETLYCGSGVLPAD
jgi:ketosteroid isomerase-like protein